MSEEEGSTPGSREQNGLEPGSLSTLGPCPLSAFVPRKSSAHLKPSHCQLVLSVVFDPRSQQSVSVSHTHLIVPTDSTFLTLGSGG